MEFNALNQFIQPLKKDYFLHVADFIKIVFILIWKANL